MESLNGKIDSDPGAPGFLPASEWNQAATEVENVIIDAGIALASGDLTQLSQAIANYVSNGAFYTDSGSANSYTLTEVGTAAPPTALRDGMIVEFETANPNTSTSSVVVAGLTSTSILHRGGVALVAGDISGRVKLRYDLANTRFELQDSANPYLNAINGYLYLQNPSEVAAPLIFQWGVVTLTGTTPVVFSLPIAYPTGGWVITGSLENQSTTFTISHASASTITTVLSVAGTPNLDWFSIGR